MSEENLRDLLARAHERLQEAGSVDPQSRELLVALMGDIERKLGPDAPRPEEDHASRLEEMAVQFEADHPALARSLRQLMDMLGKAGI